jgi:hypothetical protein
MTQIIRPTFWEYTRMSARRATREFFAPLFPVHATQTFFGSTAPIAPPATEKPSILEAEEGEVRLGKEYYDKGRTQWNQYVEKGQALIIKGDIRSAPPEPAEHLDFLPVEESPVELGERQFATKVTKQR